MLQLARIINRAYEVNEFVPVIVTGAYGWGKTAYAIKTLAEVNAKDGIPDYRIKTIDARLKFHPRDVLNVWLSVEHKQKCFVWDDAGYWLHALDWHTKEIKAISKYLNVVRTDWSGMIFTTPVFEWVAKKIREMSSMIFVEVRKINDFSLGLRPRRAIGYDYWGIIEGKLTPSFVDDFDATLPDKLYNWYYPKREMYAREAKNLLVEQLADII